MKKKRVKKLIRVIARCKGDKTKALQMEDFLNYIFKAAMPNIQKAMKKTINDIILMKPK